jgi:hypothetical protein
MTRIRTALTGALATMAVAASLPATASAASLVPAPAEACAPGAVSQPFVPWGDANWYRPLAGGTFEDGTAGWALSGATVVGGNEPFELTGPGSRSLLIPRGASATSGTFCISADQQTFRFMARRTSGSRAMVRVELLFRDVRGRVGAMLLGSATPGDGWQPSQIFALRRNAPLEGDDRTFVALRLSLLGSAGAEVAVDDVLIDPFRSR